MENPLIIFVLGLGVGMLLLWLINRGTILRLTSELAAAHRYRERSQAQLDAQKSVDDKLRDTFGALSAEALAASNTAFLEQAKLAFAELSTGARGDLEVRKQAVEQLVEPIRQGLEKVDARLTAFDAARAESHGALQAMIAGMGEAQKSLTSETAALVQALRTPTGRGQWGEMQLRRTVEMAGMLEHCDFVTQVSVDGSNGRVRPDLVVKLPGGKQLVVDAKAPLSAYLDATNATDETQRNVFLDHHARQVRTHIEALSRRDYDKEVVDSPDFVVLFLPGEAFFAAACQRDADLLDFSISRGVVPASPTTLITLLKAVHYGWRQEQLARNAAAIRDEGNQVYDRMRILGGHLIDIRRGLERAVESYNKAVGSVERSVLPATRRLRELGLGHDKEIEPLRDVNSDPLRTLTAAEFEETA